MSQSEPDEEMPENDMAPLNPSALSQKNDEMFEPMQTPEWREGAKRAFNATPKELAAAALEFASKWCNGCSYGSHCLGTDPDCGCGCK